MRTDSHKKDLRSTNQVKQASVPPVNLNVTCKGLKVQPIFSQISYHSFRHNEMLDQKGLSSTIQKFNSVFYTLSLQDVFA